MIPKGRPNAALGCAIRRTARAIPREGARARGSWSRAGRRGADGTAAPGAHFSVATAVCWMQVALEPICSAVIPGSKPLPQAPGLPTQRLVAAPACARTLVGTAVATGAAARGAARRAEPARRTVEDGEAARAQRAAASAIVSGGRRGEGAAPAPDCSGTLRTATSLSELRAVNFRLLVALRALAAADPVYTPVSWPRSAPDHNPSAWVCLQVGPIWATLRYPTSEF